MQTFLLLLHLSAQLSRQPNRFKQKQKQTNFSKFLTTQSDTATRSSTRSQASYFGSKETRTAHRRYLHLHRWASPWSPSHRLWRRHQSPLWRVDERTMLGGRCLRPTRWRSERVGAWGHGRVGRRRGSRPLEITRWELRRWIRRLRH